MAHAYWQLPLVKDSQEMFSIQTWLPVYSLIRLLQGSADADNRFQTVTHKAFLEHVTALLQWLGDFLYAASESELMNSIKKFLFVCEDYGFTVHAEKTEMFVKRAKFCGRVI